jgi:hypothetical protein
VARIANAIWWRFTQSGVRAASVVRNCRRPEESVRNADPDTRHASRRSLNAGADPRHDLGRFTFGKFTPVGSGRPLGPQPLRIVEPVSLTFSVPAHFALPRRNERRRGTAGRTLDQTRASSSNERSFTVSSSNR